MGQRLAESLMVDTVLIRRKTGSPVPDPVTGVLVWTNTTIYEGVCRLVQRSSVVRDVDAQSQLLAVQSPELHVPASVSGVLPDDLFELLTGDDAGTSGVVAGVHVQSFKTARRIPVTIGN
jgi:hypothetical protein